MKNVIISLTILIVLIIFGVAMFFIFRPGDIILQGETNADDYRVSSRVTGRVSNIYVKEGDTVTTGQIVATIDAPDLRAKAVQAGGARKSATAQQLKTDIGTRPEEKEAAFNMWQKAIVAERIALQTNTRIVKLYKEGVVSAQQRDEAQAQYDAAVRDAEAAKAQYTIALEGPRSEDKTSAAGMAEQAAGALQEVESYINDTVLYSPIDGEVSTVVARLGELAAGGFPLVTVTDMNGIYTIFNVREDLMPSFTMGKEFDVTIPALGTDIYKMKITYISPRGSYATWSSSKTTGGFELKTFEIKMYPVGTIPGLRPGMSVLYKLTN